MPFARSLPTGCWWSLTPPSHGCIPGTSDNLPPSAAHPGLVFVAPEGERCKTLSVLGEVADAFLAGGATKRSLALVFGGGATMNLGGLAAALIYRGLPMCYVPTTLMAQNDVVPSMKTAINLGGRKNNSEPSTPPV